MATIKTPTKWDQANKYVLWAIRQGLSRETILGIPHMPQFELAPTERRMLFRKIQNLLQKAFLLEE